MPETDFKQLRARAVFSDAARARLETTDEPIRAHDPATGIDLHYCFETHAGGVLRLTGGPIGQGTLAVACEPESLNLVATLLLDGLNARIR